MRVNEQAGDDVTLLGCYSSEQGAQFRIGRARLLPGCAEEPDCFIVDRYAVDHDDWVEGYVAS